jgi:F0F1-type ATP synthase membrane subunit b/b'
MMRRFWSVYGALACAATLLLWAAAPVLAQEGEASPADSPTGWIFRWLNFALVFGGIAYATWKWGAPYFRQQTEEISRKIAEGARAREAAERQRREIQAKLAGLEDEINRLRVEGKRDADAEAQRLLDMERVERERIERAARAEVEAAEREGRMELKILAARRAVELAEALLRQSLTPKADEMLFKGFVTELQENLN